MPPAPTPSPPGGGATSGDGYRIEVQSKGEPASFLCPPGETLLNAGLRQGLTLPYECATGTCGSCRARIGAGEVLVDWADAPGHAKIRQDRGDILMCQARPAGPCVLRVPSVVRTGGRHETPLHRAGVVGGVRALTGDVIHFEARLDAPITFDAGQFVVLRVPGLEGSRAYSMVNYGRDTDRIELVVKRKPSGGFSRWLFDAQRDGHQVDVFGPLGRATFHPEEDANLVMVAGGSGIAGMMSILARATQAGHFRTRRGRVFFGVRTLDDGFYLDEFARHVAAAHGNLEVTLATSHEPAASPSHPHHPGIRVESGMVHEVCARGLEPGLNPIAYVAGPPPMVDGALRVLIAGGHATPDRIRYDKFG